MLFCLSVDVSSECVHRSNTKKYKTLELTKHLTFSSNGEFSFRRAIKLRWYMRGTQS